MTTQSNVNYGCAPNSSAQTTATKRSLTTASTRTLGKAIPPKQQTDTHIAYQGVFYVQDSLIDYRAKGFRKHYKSVCDHNYLSISFIV